MWEHYEEKGHGFKCWERMSYDNNDFCGCRHGAPPPLTLEVFAVRNEKGEFYRSYSVQKRSGAWVKNIADAKVYTKKGPAQGLVTRFKNDGVTVELVTLVAKEK
jgi:hypothetical protein